MDLDEFQMVRRTYERKVAQKREDIGRYADDVIRAANDVKRRLQDGGTVYDYSGGQRVGDLQAAISELKFCEEVLSGLDFIARKQSENS